MKTLLTFFAVLFFTQLSAEEYRPNVHVYPSPGFMGNVCARQIVDIIQENQQKGLPTVLGLATGNTPLPMYEALIRIVKEENLDLSSVITINLDEYVGLAPDHPESYHNFMQANLFKDLGVKSENIHIPNAYAKEINDLSYEEQQALISAFPKRKRGRLLSKEEESWILKRRADDYEALITDIGPVDIQILGIGTNGHIGFAEPGSSFSKGTSLVPLTDTTRRDNARFFNHELDQVPTYALTMGIQTILKAKKIFLLATGEHKASIIKKALHADISTVIPASALRLHPNVEFLLDQTAASQLVFRFYNGRILRDHQIDEGELWISQGKVVASLGNADFEVDVQGSIIAPGYIDLQINGGFGIDFSREPERVEEVASQLTQYGVTSFLPTLISSTKEQYKRALSYLSSKVFEENAGASIIGIHLEGPFFCPHHGRAHNTELLLHCEDFISPKEVYGALDGVKIVTLAPELKEASRMIESLKDWGIIVSAGHSSASYQEMNEAIGAGIGLVTHLFNAMPSFHHRDPGIVGAVLTHDSLPFLVIGDKHHLHPKAIELAWKTRSDGLILVTDAMSALGLASGTYNLGSMEVEVKKGKALIKGTDTLAGSVASLDSAVRYLYTCTGCSHALAIEAASLKPAELLGIEKQKGSLHVGADADFNLLDDDLIVRACFVGGILK